MAIGRSLRSGRTCAVAVAGPRQGYARGTGRGPANACSWRKTRGRPTRHHDQHARVALVRPHLQTLKPRPGIDSAKPSGERTEYRCPPGSGHCELAEGPELPTPGRAGKVAVGSLVVPVRGPLPLIAPSFLGSVHGSVGRVSRVSPLVAVAHAEHRAVSDQLAAGLRTTVNSNDFPYRMGCLHHQRAPPRRRRRTRHVSTTSATPNSSRSATAAATSLLNQRRRSLRTRLRFRTGGP